MSEDIENFDNPLPVQGPRGERVWVSAGWKRDLGRIRELGPDEPHFNSAVKRVWDRVEELEAALRQIAAIGDPVKGTGFSPRAQQIAREALKS